MKKLICGLIVFCTLAVSVFAGAGGQQAGGSGASGPVKLSYYEGLGRAAQGHKSLATHPGWIEMQKRLNIEIEFRAPAVGNETEQFNLMIASRELPDIITYGWLSVPGGPAGYIRDDVIIKLNDVIDKWAPDLKKAFAKFPVAKREATLDDGTLYVFPQIYSNDALAYFWGPLVRKDLLEKIPGIDASKFPDNMETIEEWEKILLAVKNSGLKGDSGRDIIPLGITLDGNWHSGYFIVGAWGIGTRFTQEDGNPVYGPSDPRYLEYLTLMKRWFDLGILDREYPANAANNNRLFDEKVLDNRIFALAGAMGGASTRFTGLARPKNPAFTLATTKYPVLKKGDRPPLAFRTFDFTGTGAAITTACKNVEAAVKLLNYDYSDDGYILANFGIEGQTFTWDTRTPYTTQFITSTHNGYPRYTDLIMKNPDGFSRDIATGVFVRVGNHVGVKSPEFLEQRDNLPEQVGPRGRGMWMTATQKTKMPAVTPTQEESAEFARIMNEINTYVDEMTIKFIMGDEPLGRFNEFVATQKRMGLDRALQIQKAQIDRYNKRP
jgi:putative aldouronate transport system substrate-binding protein